MTRLNVECLEGRELMAAGVMGGISPVPPEPAAVNNLTGPLHGLFYPANEFSRGAPQGSETTVSAAPEDSVGTTLRYTAPIGSNKGSLTAEGWAGIGAEAQANG